MNSLKIGGRGCFRWLRLIFVAFLGLILLGAIYESVAEATDARAYPPSGQMVDVGGYHLHINCTGTGSPTVAIDAGWGDWSAKWSWVQRKWQRRLNLPQTYDESFGLRLPYGRLRQRIC